MENKNEVYISVDVEASGPIPGIYSMLSIGATVVFDTSKTFYAELKPINNNFIVDAIRVANLSMRELLIKGSDPEEVMASFSEWVKNVSGNARPVFVSFGNFDWMYTKWYLERFGYGNLFGINGIDIKSYYMGMNNTRWSDTTKARMPADLKPEVEHTHNALQDAVEQAKLFENMLRTNHDRHPQQQGLRTKLKRC